MRRLALAALLPACADPAPTESDTEPDSGWTGPEVTLSGYAFEFIGFEPIGGARVHLAEFPDRVAHTAADGTWSLRAPDAPALTPILEAEGFKTTALATIAPGGEDVDQLGFQMVRPGAFDVLAVLSGVVPDEARCQVALTITEAGIRDLDLDGLRRWGAHGVAGVTVSADPPSDVVVYFNAQVIPTPSLTESSRDGGVTLGNLDPGVYRVEGQHPTLSFDPITVTCAPGRFVNAGPPRGLAERPG